MENKNLIIDLDNTISITVNGDYYNSKPICSVIDKLHFYKKIGFKITIFTSRNMRTYEGNLGLINVNTLPNIISWLTKNNVPFDEVIVGKPWCGNDGFYVDDKAIRPSEFVNLSYDEIQEILKKDFKCI
jgi:capsule biosynthesis phosphatase